VLRQKSDSPFAIAQLAEQVTNLGGHVMDVASAVVSPGVIDIHVHLNEPGNVFWEGLMSGTAAAAAGGVTTLVDMPINCQPAVTDAGRLRRKRGFLWARICCTFRPTTVAGTRPALSCLQSKRQTSALQQCDRCP
jgi:dihydroorotase-like cyclic amidohydrolase